MRKRLSLAACAAAIAVVVIFAAKEDTQIKPESRQVPDGQASSVSSVETSGLPISDQVVQITSQGHTATFQLYDTVAAAEFYDQLPLDLELSNFRDAQWMFYPPNRLSVKDSEAYHDGKKGELSYYAPWGDVFMLYEDFYAGDEMHRLGIGLTGIDEIADMAGDVHIERADGAADEL